MITINLLVNASFVILYLDGTAMIAIMTFVRCTFMIIKRGTFVLRTYGNNEP